MWFDLGGDDSLVVGVATVRVVTTDTNFRLLVFPGECFAPPNVLNSIDLPNQ